MSIPLAEQLRPKTIEDFIGQEHLIGEGKPIRRMIEQRKAISMILWGPPGTGKTTMARLIAQYVDAEFIPFSAVTSGVAEVRRIIAEAKVRKEEENRDTILFVDEIHRFSKSQQDAFLPAVEEGTIILIGATTENPGFEVNAPLISRSRVFVLQQLTADQIRSVVDKATKSFPKVKWDKDALDFISRIANGDVRTALNAMELAVILADHITLKIVEDAIQRSAIYYDKKGDTHYDTISAFIKSMRGGDVDATLHYLARMIKAGEDPVFIARRLVVFAAEDIGNARTNALVLATSCMQSIHMIGYPEAKLILAQTAVYLASCPKSIASTEAIGAALADIDLENLDPIPLHLRNPANYLDKNLGFGKGHIRYPWKVEKETGKKIDQKYLPKNLENKKYYHPDF